VRSFFGQGGEGLVIQMWTSALFGAKTSDFSKFMVCPHEQGHFADRGGGQSFAILCGRPLWTASKFE